MPIWMSSSAPSDVVMETACPVSNIMSTVPFAGATIRPSFGCTAAPGPRMPCAKVGSGTSVSGTTVPETGEAIVMPGWENRFFSLPNMIHSHSFCIGLSST